MRKCANNLGRPAVHWNCQKVLTNHGVIGARPPMPAMPVRPACANAAGSYKDNWGKILTVTQAGCQVQFTYKGKFLRGTVN